MTYDQLQRLLDQRDRQLEEFKNKLEQIQRQFQLAAHNHKEEVGQKDELLAELNVRHPMSQP